MDNQDKEAIRPRSKQERAAYIAGYAAAIIDITDNGMDTAVTWLQEMAEMDGLVQAPNAQN
jgi:hypothetical protein